MGRFDDEDTNDADGIVGDECFVGVDAVVPVNFCVDPDVVVVVRASFRVVASAAKVVDLMDECVGREVTLE